MSAEDKQPSLPHHVEYSLVKQRWQLMDAIETGLDGERLRDALSRMSAINRELRHIWKRP